MNICWLDIVILIPVLYGLVRGLIRGIVTELMAIIAVIIGIVGTRLWGAAFTAWLMSTFEWQQNISTGIAYSLLFIGIATGMTILGRLFIKLLKAIHLSGLNRALGGVFGMAKWTLILLGIIYINNLLDARFQYMPTEVVKQSVLYGHASDYSVIVWNNASKSNILHAN